MVADPQTAALRLCRFAGIAWDQDLNAAPLPSSRFTLTPYDPNKWRKNAADIEPILPLVVSAAERAREFVLGHAHANP